MHAGAVLSHHLLYELNLWPKGSELGKFLLNSLQPFKPLAVGDVGSGCIHALRGDSYHNIPHLPSLIVGRQFLSARLVP
jgi:hypothetical protein